MMRFSAVVTILLFFALFSCSTSSPATAQDGEALSNTDQTPGLTSDLQDPVVELQFIRQKRDQRIPAEEYALFRTSPLTPLRERGIQAEKLIYEATDLKIGTNLNTLMQGLSDEIPGEDDYGMASFLSIVSTYDGCHKGEPNQGEITLGLEGRWNWGTTDPVALGQLGLGSLGFTANPFGTYTPTFIVRNLFWRQGSREAGWMYRIGRVTPDQFLMTSRHLNPLTTYSPISGTGPFAMGISDSGLGMFAGLFLTDYMNICGVVSDANADRFDFGDLDEGDLFSAVELQVKVLPLTENAGYSKVAFWHNDGTKFGNAGNGGTGKEGWGVFIKYEQEVTCDGRAIAIGRWGRSYKDSALYDRLTSAHLVFYDPFFRGSYKALGFNADACGIAYNMVKPTAAPRDESNVEAFYRFLLFPQMDATLSYQMILNPALDPSNEFGSAFSLRLRSTW